jgi:hypothetical protein
MGAVSRLAPSRQTAPTCLQKMLIFYQQYGNRLRVFRTANTAYLDRGLGQERWWRVGPSEKYVAR